MGFIADEPIVPTVTSSVPVSYVSPVTERNYDGLLMLADMLDQDASNPEGVHFNLGVVIDAPANGSIPSMSCGTQACAMGIAGLSGKFPGLSFQLSPSEWGMARLTFNGERVMYKRAAKFVFGLDNYEASHLFSPECYDGDIYGEAGERMVANRIRQFVAACRS